MKNILIKSIKIYQTFFSPEKSIWVRVGVKRQQYICPFYPSCSDYSIQAIEKYGVGKGLSMSFKRILRCRPGTKPQIDNI